MRLIVNICGASALLFGAAGCSAVEPLDATTASTSKSVPTIQSDQAVLADKVGQAPPGVTPLPWANPSTGSAGVIEQIDANADGSNCRAFVSSEHTLQGNNRFSGLACPTSDASWKLTKQ